MAAVVERKIIKLGNKYPSFVVSLPKSWYNYYEPKQVRLYYEDVIIVFPPGIDPRRKASLLTALKY